MATTIDSLQIEIQTSSTNASVGIRDLAKALGELKANGTIGVATKNLKALSDTLAAFKNASNATTSIGKLSGAMERLKNIGSITGIANSIKKLSDNLRGIDNINIDSVAPQIERVAAALGPLSAVKAGGISTMMNGLKKLGEVTKSLDDDTIGAFAEKVKKLNELLDPLSQKMTTIKTGFAAINTNARSAGSGVQKFGKDVNTTTLNLASMVTVIQGVIQALQPVVRMLISSIDAASEWEGIEVQFGKAFGEEADAYYEKITKVTEALRINKQEFMENSAMASSMLIGFGVDRSDARKMGVGYTELAYDIWASFNNVYKTLDGADGAMAAVRSAIAGEVEPIRRAGFTIVESTLEQTAANHGMTISIEKATEAQKSYLRYLSLVDQARQKGVVGTYAAEMDTAEGVMRTLAQQTKSLAQAFGSLFLPVLVRVIPYVQAFVELLTDAVHWIASLFGIEIQPVDFSGYGNGVDGLGDSANNATDALGSATKAAKELKNATLGIDELNVISPQSGSGSGGSGGAGGAGAGGGNWDVDSLWDQSIFDSVQDKVDELKGQVKDALLDLAPVAAGLATALAGLKLTNLLDDIELAGFKLGNLGKVISVAGIALAVGKLVWDFTGAYLEDGNWASFFGALGTTAIGSGLAYKFAGKGGLGFTLMVSGIAMLSRLAFDLSEGTVDFGDPETWITMLTGGVEAVVGGVLSWKVLKPIVTGALGKLTGSGVMTTITSTIIPALSAAAPYVAVAAAVVGGIVLAFVDYDFTDIGRTIGEKIGSALRTVGGWIADVGKAIWEGLKAALNWVKESLDIDDVWDVLAVLFVPGELWRRIEPDLKELAGKINTWIEEKIENLKGNINEFFGGFFDGLFDGLGIDMSWAEKITEFFDIEYTDIVEAVINPASIGKHIITGINNGINSNAKLSALRDKISAMWTDAKTWWDTKKAALSSYVPTIGSIKDKLSSAWTSAKDWWNKNRGNLATYTPSIGKIWEKLKSAWTSAKDWWNKSRSSLSYTPSIGSIKNKLSSAWTSAKNWWNKSKGSMSYTPSIGSIKDRVVSAWDSAKKWWNSNAKLSTKLNIQTPKLTVNWGEVSALGKTFKYPKSFSLKFAANGGIFDQGSLVWAGERGAEIVANAGGGRTGVMNVQQMQDAVYEGVYAAVVAAMGAMGGDNSQPVNVYLDGRQIAATVEKRQRERGASIMGQQVYSY